MRQTTPHWCRYSAPLTMPSRTRPSRIARTWADGPERLRKCTGIQRSLGLYFIEWHVDLVKARGFHLTAVQQSNYSPLRAAMGCNRLFRLPPALANCFRLREMSGSNPCLSAITISFSYTYSVLQSVNGLPYNPQLVLHQFPRPLRSYYFQQLTDKPLKGASSGIQGYVFAMASFPWFGYGRSGLRRFSRR